MTIKNIFSTLLGFSLLSLSACSDFVDSYQEDPNNASDAPIEAVLNAAFTGTIIAHEGEDARLACMWSRQFTGSDRQYAALEIYSVNAENFDWDKYYLVAENSKIVIEKSAETNDKLASGIARTLQAHSYGMMASMWGDIPYTQANKFIEFPDPVYDPQPQVYADVQTLLDQAITDLSGNPSNGDIEDRDFYFGGDPVKWSQVASSLKARFSLHLGNYAAAISSASKGVKTADDEWIIPHATGSYNQDQNIYSSFGEEDRLGYMTANVAYLPAILDPANAAYRGNAKTDESARFAFAFTGEEGAYDLNYSGMWAATASFPLVSAIETELILAEAEWRGNSDPDAALTHLNNARAMLAAQFPEGKYEAYTLADFDNGGIASRAGFSRNDALLYEILEEKYVSLMGQMEVFNDVRRTDNFLEIPPTTGSQLPQRFLYPQEEIDANVNTPDPIPDLFEQTPINK
ncbi:MAG: SusD/RagB family nutrient-binding outer membrane lipoprotein [Lewinellaceae bacterium]|nr:SusD/RagB family nutrient-binding outer membrane lipoprotein [Phaeodactylibacter sp.]MCB9040310.1 SusD/RagB family nutrient-binding outer membrane lipoprotein [Lewinellaceae bacterium]